MTTMNRIDTLYDGARGLATIVGSNVKHAGKWLDAGAKVGALKGGAKVATTLAKRHPVLLAATAAGAGLLWYAAYRRAKRAQEGNGHGAIEGSARRVEAKRAGTATKRTTRATKARGSTRSRQTTS
jgi:glutamate-1-semialdehyde aminotransferase